MGWLKDALRKVMNILTRPIRTFNIDNRARKIITQDKPKPAPRYSRIEEQLKQLYKEHPEIIEQYNRKHPDLDTRLKSVYVTSLDNQIIKDKPQLDRSLPLLRTTPPDTRSTSYELTNVPAGRLTMKQIVSLFQQYQENPEEHNSTTLAAQYKLNDKLVENILSHYSLYTVKLPKKYKKDDLPFLYTVFDKSDKSKELK